MTFRRGIGWLIDSAENPADCRRAWSNEPRNPYLIPTGETFDLISVDLRLGLETADLLRRRRLPLGPVALDYSARRAGFLLPPGSRDTFERLVFLETLRAPQYRYLDEGSFAVLPGPVALAADRHQWLISPPYRPTPELRQATALALMLVAAAELLRRADRFGDTPPPSAPTADQTDSADFMDAVDTALKRMAMNSAH